MGNCKISMPVVGTLASEGRTKQLALFLSLKKIYNSSHIHNFKKVDLSKLGFRISRPTYLKYIEILISIRLVKRDGKGGIILIGQDAMSRLFETGRKTTYCYLKNDEHLRDSIERVALKKCIQDQEQKIRLSSHKVYQKRSIVSKVGDNLNISCESLEGTTSVSCKKLAQLIGLRSAMTGVRRERKWRDGKFIQTVSRSLVICSKLSANAKNILLANPRNFTLGNNICRRLANQVAITDLKFGRKIDETPMTKFDFFIDNY